MERVGWRFWRCWGSSFYLDPDACMAELETALKAMGIAPREAEPNPMLYVEQRTVAHPATASDDEPQHPTMAQTPLGYPDHGQAVAEVGDRVVIAFGDEPTRHLAFVIGTERHHPEGGVVHHSHPFGQAILGAAEHDEVEIPMGGAKKLATVIRLEKGGQARAA